MTLSIGDQAPAFKLKDAAGQTIRLADFKGQKVVLYFYPKDMTPGCTKEACGFQTDQQPLAAKNAVVIGVSTDDETSHQKFADKYGLQFPLLADTDHAVADSYGVWQEKNNYGKKYWGIKRTTFIIDEQGKIAHIFKKVDTAKHSQEVLAVLEKLA
ncbi:MAG: thioredoxin-dependent thiol peroxidase [Acidobacteria bacterium]|nr:thioredoxin-dependent thiol peroxidase [Acidobacteriota bacterium]